MDNSRRIYNPVQKDYVTFLKTASETQGEYTLVEVELSPKGGVSIHYHKTYSEKFDCLEGELKVQSGKAIHMLSPGQTVTAHPNVNHRFFNTSDKVCKFRVELRPGSPGFEKSLQVGYGLARDGETNGKGFPRNRHALAWLFEISESNLPGWMSVFEFILRRQAKKARESGLDQELIRKYVRF
jgi:quercetin dioxygenase-like cupin family protein